MQKHEMKQKYVDHVNILSLSLSGIHIISLHNSASDSLINDSLSSFISSSCSLDLSENKHMYLYQLKTPGYRQKACLH